MFEGKTKVEEDGEDEIYTLFFKCMKYDENKIISDFVYCPHCGRKIEWEKEFKEKIETGRRNALNEAQTFLNQHTSEWLKLEYVIDFVQKFIKALPEAEREKVIPDGVCRECLKDKTNGRCWNCYDSRRDYD